MNSRLLVAKRIGLIALLISTSLPVIVWTAQVQEQVDDNRQVLATAIKGLASDDELERTAARESLLRSGEQAIPPLLKALRSLIPNVEGCPAGSNLPCRTGFITNSSPKTRARSEIISLLAQLKAVTAVPLLIKMLSLWDSESIGVRYSGPEMLALIEIGSAAVPELLNTLRLAEERRSSVPLVDGSLAPYLEIEVRIIEVLGRIGDERALELFEELKKSNTSAAVQTRIKEAEERIKQKAHQK